MSEKRQRQPRITVVIPCFNDGKFLQDAIDSIQEPEQVDIVVVDDGSVDPKTLAIYLALEARGIRVVKHGQNRGLSQSRNTGLAATETPFVFNLDSDDLLLPGVLSRLASLLQQHPEADAAYGDYEEFGARSGIRRTATVLDPFRIAFVNKSPGLAMFRRDALLQAGGWETLGYQDWDLWMTFAEQQRQVVHSGEVVFRYRIHTGRMFAEHRGDHAAIYRTLQSRHPGIFDRRVENWRRSPLPLPWKVAYPVLYAGGRPRLERFRQRVRRVVPAWSPGL